MSCFFMACSIMVPSYSVKVPSCSLKAPSCPLNVTGSLQRLELPVTFLTYTIDKFIVNNIGSKLITNVIPSIPNGKLIKCAVPVLEILRLAISRLVAKNIFNNFVGGSWFCTSKKSDDCTRKELSGSKEEIDLQNEKAFNSEKKYDAEFASIGTSPDLTEDSGEYLKEQTQG